MSPCGVDVACALMCAMSAAVMPDSARARRIARAPPRPAGVGLRDVVRVGGDAGAEHLGVDPGAARLGVLLGLQDEDAGALTEHEAVAAGVPGTGDRRGVTRVLRQRHHVREGGHGQRVDRRLGAARDDHVGAAEADLVDREGDALVAGGTRRDGGVHGGAGADVQADLGRGGVGHQHRDGERRDPAGALLLEDVVVVEEGVDAADAGGHRDPDALVLEVARLLQDVEARVAPRFHRRDHRELRGAVQAAGLDPLEDLGRLDGHASGDLDRHLLGPVVGQGADAGTSVHERVPGAGDVASDGAGGAEAGHHDSCAAHLIL